MRLRFVLLACCLCLAARGDDTSAPGITRVRAIAIAKSHCAEYPGRFKFVDKVHWVPEKGYWSVLLDDESGRHGRIYYIDRDGKVVGTHDIDEEPPPA